MGYKIVIEEEKIWRKDCDRIDRRQLKNILRKIRELEQEPWPDNVQVKQLQDYDLADYRLRVGDYRVLFEKDEDKKIVHLLRVRHRSKLY